MIQAQIKDCYDWTTLFVTNSDSFTMVYKYILEKGYNKFNSRFELPIYFEDPLTLEYIEATTGIVVEDVPDLCIIISTTTDPLEGRDKL